jgi:hypothetical protein
MSLLQYPRRAPRPVDWLRRLAFAALLAASSDITTAMPGARPAGAQGHIEGHTGAHVAAAHDAAAPPAAVAAASPAAASFLETFDGQPAAPQPWRPAGWDVTVHSRDLPTWHAPEPMHAGHGRDCAPPPAAHLMASFEQAVYSCRDHLMTAINAGGYGAIYLTPDRLLDFSAGEAVLRFDLSTARTSGRDWIDVWLTPFDDNVQLPLYRWLPDGAGEPRRALHVNMGVFAPQGQPRQTMFTVETVRDFVPRQVPGNWWTGYESVLAPSATRRDTFELRVSRTRVRFGMPDYGLWWVDAEIDDLGWDRAVVQLGHHSYTPTKDCWTETDCAPNTWHWDNVGLSPAVPFTMVHAEQRRLDERATGPVTFGRPAPADARLRFLAVSGKPVEVSLDGGATWTPATPQAAPAPRDGHARSYWHPVPAGTTQVWLRGSGGYWGDRWLVRDAALWALPEG